LFAGPSGTGKTELAKALTETLYHDEKNLIRLDMSEYMEKHNVAKILGSPPGYIGFGDEPYLIREIRQRPGSVVLLDEIEKAHPDVLNIFLQILDEGRMTDAKGRVINFSEAIIILTSNLGTQKNKGFVGFKLGMEEGEEKKQREFEIYKDKVQDVIKKFLLPELLNRIQEIVVFKPLSKKSIDKIIDKFIDQLNKRLAEKSVTVQLDTSAREYLIEHGYSEEYGARNLSRIVEQSIYDPLSRAILAGEIKGNKIAFFQYKDGMMEMELNVKEASN
jgi:ATP-dependent Clp protease ATP-binding subunit ClpA